MSYETLDTYYSYISSVCLPVLLIFYMRVLEKFPAELMKSCVTKQHVGVNVLKNILPELSKKSSAGVHYTYHSLRATAISYTHV